MTYIKKEVHNRCRQILITEIRKNQYKLNENRYKINNLAKEQRILKAQIGELYKILKLIK